MYDVCIYFVYGMCVFCMYGCVCICICVCMYILHMCAYAHILTWVLVVTERVEHVRQALYHYVTSKHQYQVHHRMYLFWQAWVFSLKLFTQLHLTYSDIIGAVLSDMTTVIVWDYVIKALCVFQEGEWSWDQMSIWQPFVLYCRGVAFCFLCHIYWLLSC